MSTLDEYEFDTRALYPLLGTISSTSEGDLIFNEIIERTVLVNPSTEATIVIKAISAWSSQWTLQRLLSHPEILDGVATAEFCSACMLLQSLDPEITSILCDFLRDHPHEYFALSDGDVEHFSKKLKTEEGVNPLQSDRDLRKGILESLRNKKLDERQREIKRYYTRMSSRS